MKKSNLEAKFYEVINIDCNHRYVAGSIRLGKTNAQLQTLLNDEKDIPEPIVGDRVISELCLLNLDTECGNQMEK